MQKTTLVLQDLSKYYADGQSVNMGLNQINLSFTSGEFVAITGESGSGKSTLAHVLGGILPFEGGELLLDGRPTSHYDAEDWERYRRDKISFISQDYGILPGSTVMVNVTSALRLAGLDKTAARAAAETALRKVELWAFRNRRAAKLSSGQKQRLSIARALAKPAPILIADEPTGNLDAENSAKVIALLAEAAKERLVLLITHDFDVAADAVTRRISLRDGQVTMDAPLREPKEPAQTVHTTPTGKKQGLSLYTASLQLRARPIWCAMMLCFFALTVFALFSFAGTFLANLDDTSTRLYDDSAFLNGDSRRIVVIRADGGEMTAEDEEALLAVRYVEALETYSYLADVQYAYRNEHYKWTYSAISGSVLLNTTAMPFAQTVPNFADGWEFLTAGRLPETIYEVVAVGDESILGESFPLYLQDAKHWGQDYYLCLDVTVVGVTNYGEGLYLHDDIARTLTAYLRDPLLLYLPVYDLAEDEAYVSDWIFQRYYKNEPDPRGWLRRLSEPDNWDTALIVQITGSIPSTHTSAVGVSPANFEYLMLPGQGDQISLTIEDYAYTDEVLEDVRALGYAAISPYREGSTTQDPVLGEQRTNTLRVCCIAFLAVLLLQMAALWAMFRLEAQNYRLLRDLGLRCKTTLRSVLCQVLLFALCGQVLGVSAILLCGALGVEQVSQLLCYLPLSHCVVLSLLHLAACLLTALWSMRALRRQLYPGSVQPPDLDWEVSV